MRDDQSIPEFASTTAPRRQSVAAPVKAESSRRFRKPGAVAELRERSVAEHESIEWSLFLNGNLVTSRVFHGAQRGDYDREVEGVTDDLAKAGWLEDLNILRVG
jgi:hypothetical protein